MRSRFSSVIAIEPESSTIASMFVFGVQPADPLAPIAAPLGAAITATASSIAIVVAMPTRQLDLMRLPFRSTTCVLKLTPPPDRRKVIQTAVRSATGRRGYFSAARISPAARSPDSTAPLR